MADVITHHCPNCGGPLTFNPSDQKFHCDYCLSIFTVEDIEKFEANEGVQTIDGQTSTASIEEANTGDMDLFLCPSCGAQIVTDHTTAATYCYFCHNPVVLSGRLTGEFLPNKVLPFTIDREKAVTDFLAWTQKKRFIPKDFFNKEQIEKMTGVYFPYWVVDAETAGNLTGKGTSLRVWIVGDLEYTETKIYQIFRKGTAKIQHLTKNALKKNIQQKMVEGVQPFPIDQAVDFHTEYLSGFQAEKRDIEIKDIDELERYAEENPTDVGIICVPRINAQKVCDILVKCGIKGIWNFAPVDLKVPSDVIVENVHLSESLLTLIYLMHSEAESHLEEE